MCLRVGGGQRRGSSDIQANSGTGKAKGGRSYRSCESRDSRGTPDGPVAAGPGLRGNGGRPPALPLGIRSCRGQGPLSSLAHFTSAARASLES